MFLHQDRPSRTNIRIARRFTDYSVDDTLKMLLLCIEEYSEQNTEYTFQRYMSILNVYFLSKSEKENTYNRASENCFELL